MELKDNTFIVVPSKAVKLYGLTGNNLLVYSIIDGLSKHGKTWTNCSLSYMMLWTNLKRESRIKKIIENLVMRGLVETENRTEGNKIVKYYRTAQLLI